MSPNSKDPNSDISSLSSGICEILLVMNNSVCYFKNYFLDNLALNKNCIWPLLTCIAASRTLRSSCGICWRAFTRMWIRWQVNLSLSPSRMRISASMNPSFSWIYFNMFMTTLIKAVCLTCLMNYRNLQGAVITYVLVHVHIYFCGFSQSIICIFDTYVHVNTENVVPVQWSLFF